MSMWYIIIASVLIAAGILVLINIDPLGIIGGPLLLAGVLVLIVGGVRFLWKNRSVLKR